jgi:hypothetical protein
MNYLNVLKTIYTKEKVDTINENWEATAITKTLVKDTNNLSAIKKIISFLYYIKPLHYFYLLYFNIGKKNFVPRFPKIEKESKKEQDDFEKFVLEYLGWDYNNLKYSTKLFNNIVLKNKKQWKEMLGI